MFSKDSKSLPGQRNVMEMSVFTGRTHLCGNYSRSRGHTREAHYQRPLLGRVGRRHDGFPEGDQTEFQCNEKVGVGVGGFKTGCLELDSGVVEGNVKERTRRLIGLLKAYN